jgi:acetyl esterase/lipase
MERVESPFLILNLSDQATDRTILGPGGGLALRQFVPPSPGGVYLHLHGGGWVIGRAHHQDAELERVMRECNVAVLSVDYRLAPEHPYPAALDDAEAAAAWLLENARREFGTDRLVIGGFSAGAYLSATTLLRLRDKHGTTGFAGANLIGGAYMFWTPSLRQWGEKRMAMTTADCDWFLEQFAPPQPHDDPAVAPLYADLRGLPPALFTVGTLDPLLDDSLFMHMRWIAAGNDSELAVYPGGIHGLQTAPTAQGLVANECMEAFIRRAIS